MEYVIPDGFRNLFRISPNPNAPPIPFVDGRCIVDIPQSGLLLVRDMEPFRRFHSGAARYTSGALLPVAVSASTSEDIQLFYLSTDLDGNSWWRLDPGPANTHVSQCALRYSLPAIGHIRARIF